MPEVEPTGQRDQMHSPGGCTIDMPPSNHSRRRHIVRYLIYLFIHLFIFVSSEDNTNKQSNSKCTIKKTARPCKVALNADLKIEY